MKTRVLITIRGGNVESVIADDDIEVYIRDFDNIESGDDDECREILSDDIYESGCHKVSQKVFDDKLRDYE